MKSSTIRRSTLSRETMEVIENLAKDQEANGLLNEYIRPEDLEVNKESENADSSNKAQEIDLLWQNFKSMQFNTKSPAAYISLGFILGVVSTLIVFACIGTFVVKSDVKLPESASNTVEKLNIFDENKEQEQTLEEQADSAMETMNMKVSVPSESEVASVSENSETNVSDNVSLKNSKKYVVKDGDTVENIIKKHYGSWSEEKANMVMKANNLKNLDRINIGQELIMPNIK